MTDPAPRWDPQPADRILLAGDEHAIETMSLILATLPAATRGQVFVEVGSEDAVGTLSAPGRVTVTWLVRERGQALQRSLDAWLSEMLPVSAFGESSVYAWIAADGPARLITSD
jgi:NADPH-dependent ferric siderophore reductase